MAVRNIIDIDEALCDGCGECVPSCAEGALQIVGGKARLVSDVLCDGLGACLGQCPTGALTVVTREADDFDEAVVEALTGHRPDRPASAAPAGAAVPRPAEERPGRERPGVAAAPAGGCPGSQVRMFAPAEVASLGSSRPPASLGAGLAATAAPSALRQWPVQLHLVPPAAPFLSGRDLLLAADCVPVAVSDFHAAFLDGRALAIACPKLDQHLDAYVEKLAAMVDLGGVQSLTVAVMEVPCCGGLVRLVQQALARASRAVPVRVVVVGIRGQMLSDATH